MKTKPIHYILLGLIVSSYVAIGVLYATFTPTWQVPDEPAHYNYIRARAEEQRFPVREAGDYDQELLNKLLAQKFPPELSVEPVEYEDHQPPLYYLLATPVYRLFDGALVPLRLLSVFFGAGLLIAAFGTVRTLFPAQPALALIAAAFIAFIPQHTAMTAGVNNDGLAGLLVGGTLWALVAYAGAGKERERPWPIGLLLASALLTKTTAYVVTIVAVAAVALRWRRDGTPWTWAVGQLAWMFVPAALLSAPWFVRNALTYGWHDPLGLVRHGAIVEGQPRSSEWLVTYGWAGLLRRFARTTFHSFWGQFGWMAVPLPTYIYRGLGGLSVLLVGGFIAWVIGPKRNQPALDSDCESALGVDGDCAGDSCSSQIRDPANSLSIHHPISLLALSASLTALSYLWYNLTFVQHQGRYLFPALVPIGTAAALGAKTLATVLPKRARPWAIAAIFCGLAMLDVYCLFKFVMPFLAR